MQQLRGRLEQTKSRVETLRALIEKGKRGEVFTAEDIDAIFKGELHQVGRNETTEAMIAQLSPMIASQYTGVLLKIEREFKQEIRNISLTETTKRQLAALLRKNPEIKTVAKWHERFVDPALTKLVAHASKKTAPPRPTSPKPAETPQPMSMKERMRAFQQQNQGKVKTLIDKARESDFSVLGEGQAVVTLKGTSRPGRYPPREGVTKCLLRFDGEKVFLRDSIAKNAIARPLEVKGVHTFQSKFGQSQSQGFVLEMKDGRKYFCKLTLPGVSGDGIAVQNAADRLSRAELGDKNPFVAMSSSLGIRFNNKQYDLMLFPMIDGVQLVDVNDGTKVAKQLGKVLGQIHAKQRGNIEGLAARGYTLKKTLYHPDFQASNVLMERDGTVHLIDTAGLRFPRKENEAYGNLHEALNEVKPGKERELLLHHYVEQYPIALREPLLAKTKEKLIELFGII